MKKYKIRIMIGAVLLLAFSSSVHARTLYESKERGELSRGATYEHSERVTENGLLDIHVLTVDLHNEHLKLKTLISQTEYGLKETTAKLAGDNGAFAAVNGDFFGMAGSYSAPLGLEIVDGSVAASTSSNLEGMKNATLFIGESGLPYMGYVNTDLSFYNNGEESFKLYALNHSTEFVLPTCIDKNAYETTEPLDARFVNLTKIVVENDSITYISQPGEIVTLPEADKGYIIVINENTAYWNLSKFAVGQSAELRLSAAIDYAGIEEAISGGGKILSNGYLVTDGYYVSGRQPRTAVGLSEDRSRLIMMVVDGRGGSLGASHEEMADLLREYGAYNAMHLDGGGSSTMAIQPHAGSDMEVVNTPSDGAQRKVINALGLINESEFSTVQSLAAEAETTMTFKTMPLKLDFYAVDEFLNRMPLDYSLVSVYCNAEDGTYNNGYFYPSRTGEIKLLALYGDFKAEIPLYSMELAQLNTSRGAVTVGINSQTPLYFSAISTEGFTAEINPSYVTAQSFPDGLAGYRDGVLTGLNARKGYMKFSFGAVEKYISVETGTREVPVDFSGAQGRVISYQASPAENAGFAAYASTPGGEPGMVLKYDMQEVAQTQAAYAVFNPPVALPEDVISLKLSVYGDASNNWLRGRIVDAAGTAHAVDFARYVDFEGQKTLEAKIPANAVYPVSLERIYIAALENSFVDAGGRSLYFTNLVANCPLGGQSAELPPSTVYKDNKNAVLTGQKNPGETDIRILGDITYTGAQLPENYTAVQDEYKALAFTVRDDVGIFLGQTDNTAAEIPCTKWINQYSCYPYGNVSVINLTSGKGSLFASDANQWLNLPADLQNSGKNILIVIDNNPLNSIPAKEFELLSELFAKHIKQGKNITKDYSATNNAATAREGVRYIGLEPLFQKDGSLNPDFRSLKLRVSADNMLWSFVQYDTASR